MAWSAHQMLGPRRRQWIPATSQGQPGITGAAQGRLTPQVLPPTCSGGRVETESTPAGRLRRDRAETVPPVPKRLLVVTGGASTDTAG
ncbi:hypothetical protein [Frankia sp. AvcI1]|uniref:hypothetical protein n=1 Tax=Frankia sp. AvcI1 TaxID=573496 RepID=UPI000B1FD0CF|nr:hypothetical protein [Frankia sp. AvcI1]